MRKFASSSWTKLALFTAISIQFTAASAAIEFGGLSLDDNAFADRVLSTDFTGLYAGCNGFAPADIDEAIAGYNLNTWIDYGYHDMKPGQDGDYNSSAPPYQYIELAFTDNVVVNQPGNDLAIFQIGTANSVRVALDKVSIQTPYAPGTVSVIANAQAMPTPYVNNCIQVTVIYVDLSDLGVAEGQSIYRVFLTSPLMENGDVAWLDPAYPPLGVPELAGAAALHSAAKGNYAPEVDAGDDQIISQPVNVVGLAGDVLDDGLPAETLTTTWTQISGPAAAIDSAASLSTLVTLPSVGTYVFRLTGYDGSLASQDDVTITVTAADASAPSTPANLVAEVLSNTGVALTWESSSDNVAIKHYRIYRNDQLLTTTQDTFYNDFNVTAATTYWYSVQAVDPAGNLSAQSNGEVVTLSEPLLAVRVATGSDDVEEFANGGIDRFGGDLELVEDGARGAQHVGLRFQNVGLPAGVEIVKAWLEFTADETSAEATNLTIHGIAADSPATFSGTSFDVSSRAQTLASASWSNIAAWTKEGNRHQSADIAAIVQELVDRGGWQSGNAMGFVIAGSGRRVAESYDSVPTAAPTLFVEYIMGPPVNQAPAVSAGDDAALVLPANSILLDGSVADDGLPAGTLVTGWEQLSGPGVVAFADPSNPSTTATFPVAGEYALRLSADDSVFTVTDTVVITVHDPDVTPPTAPVISNATASFDGAVILNWTASTDDSGVQTYHVYRDGNEIAQMAGLSFQDSGLAELTQYAYQIQAEDVAGNLSDFSAAVLVLVPAAPEPGTLISVSVATGADDVEEADDGRMDLFSTDLELVDEFGMGNQRVGLRFAGVPVPNGATIVNAWLRFETDETGATATSLSISALAAANVPAFTNIAFNLSSRATLGAVAWNAVPAWTALDQDHDSPSLTALVQALVNNPAWAAGNAMGFVISGSGTRTAESYDGERPAAPTLFIEYREGDPVNAAPVVDAGADQIMSLPDDTAALSGAVTDDGVSGQLSLLWSQVSGPGVVVFSAAGSAATNATFPVAGTYELQLLADDGEFQATDSLIVQVTAPDAQAPTQPQNLQADAAGLGSVALSWEPSTDNVGVVAYRIFRDSVALIDVATLEYTDSGLASDTYYEYEVAALDAAANVSVHSAVVGVTTPFVPDTVSMIEIAVATGNDDAEQADDGRMDLGSTDLELVDEVGMGNQHVGVRFTNVQLPANAVITSAYLQFQADEPAATATNLTIRAIQEANAAAFTTAAFNLSNRAVLGNVQWSSLPGWTVDQNYVTPDIAALVQAVVNQPGWNAGNAMGFIITGTGTRTAESYNGEQAAAPRLHIEYYEGEPANQPPVPNAGSDLLVSMSDPVARLSGAYADDGLTPVTLEWTQIAGPAAAVIALPEALSTDVTFAQDGEYTFSLRVDDGEFSVVDSVSVTVTAPDAQVPTAPTGVAGEGHLDATVSLTWNAATDNVGVTAYRVYRDAVQIAEVAGLQYTDTGLASEAYYGYSVTAIDAAGNESASSAVVGVEMPFIPETVIVLNVAVATGNDDVEEAEDGRMDLASTDLELVDEVGMGNQQVGLRFANVQLPQGAVVTRAWIQLEADEPGAGATSLNIAILDNANVPPFTTAAFNLSSRPTLGGVAWNALPAWAVDQVHQSPDLADLVQAVVSSAGWAPGNALGFVITGTGTRTAESYNGERPAAPVLHLEYYEGESVNQAPVVNAGSDQNVVLPDSSVSLSAAILDDGQTGTLDVTWSVLSGPGLVAFSNEFAAVTDATFTVSGDYLLQVLADDGEFAVSDTLVVSVLEADEIAPTVPTDVQANLQINGDVLVSWLAATDNTAVAGYRVYRNALLVATVTDGLTYVDTGLGLGSYDYVVTAYDFANNESADSAVATVLVDSVLQSLSVAVSAGEDDSEEQANGSIQLYSTDLEIVDEVGFSLQTVGVRFRNVQVPAGAEIVNAYITFEVDEASSGVANIQITVEDSANPLVFSATAYDITNRTTLVESVSWTIADAWGVDQRHNTPNLAVLVQALVDRGDWVGGGAMVFVFSGAGSRTVESYNGEIQAAPVLHVEYR